jgi:thiol-disulfide isomerase/thioredoxin
MNWKMILLGLAVLAVLSLITLYALGISFNKPAILQGFQGGAPANNTFTMYYADWCGHCKAAKPVFTEFAAAGKIKVGNKECIIQMVSPENEPEKAKGKNIKGFPSFLLETVDGKVVEYTGERNVDGYMAFLNTNLGGGI